MDNVRLEALENLKKMLVGGKVSDIKIGYSTTIYINNGENFISLSIGPSDFLDNEKSFKILPQDINSKSILASLFQSTLVEIQISDVGELSMQFQNPSHRVVTKSGFDYEAWEINDAKGFKIVCMPGGELAVWLGKSEK